MKKVYSLLLAGMVFASCQQEATKEVEKEIEIEKEIVETPKTGEATKLGVAFPMENSFTINDLASKLSDSDSVAGLTVSGTVASVCQMKGCWMTMKTAEGKEVRVTFKDYDSVVMPMDAAGKDVVIHGIAKRKVVSVDTQKHFAKDAGESEEAIAAITEPKESVVFVADGVVIK